jgi:hypothetical protein
VQRAIETGDAGAVAAAALRIGEAAPGAAHIMAIHSLRVIIGS